MWKKAGGHIIKLIIPKSAKRSCATTRKYRSSFAVVKQIDGGALDEYQHEAYDHTTVYKVGENVYPNDYDENRWNECSNGIHWFLTKAEAEAW